MLSASFGGRNCRRRSAAPQATDKRLAPSSARHSRIAGVRGSEPTSEDPVPSGPDCHATTIRLNFLSIAGRGPLNPLSGGRTKCRRWADNDDDDNEPDDDCPTSYLEVARRPVEEVTAPVASSQT